MYKNVPVLNINSGGLIIDEETAITHRGLIIPNEKYAKWEVNKSAILLKSVNTELSEKQKISNCQISPTNMLYR